MTAPLAARPAPPAASRWRIVERSEPSQEWVDAWWAVDGRGGPVELEVVGAILARIEPPRIFVECCDESGVADVGLGVLDLPWVGIYCMATMPHARRQGCARSILDHLRGSATARGAQRAHLAVSAMNEPACRMYEASGFETHQEYSYFTLNTV